MCCGISLMNLRSVSQSIAFCAYIFWHRIRLEIIIFVEKFPFKLLVSHSIFKWMVNNRSLSFQLVAWWTRNLTHITQTHPEQHNREERKIDARWKNWKPLLFYSFAGWALTNKVLLLNCAMMTCLWWRPSLFFTTMPYLVVVFMKVHFFPSPL